MQHLSISLGGLKGNRPGDPPLKVVPLDQVFWDVLDSVLEVKRVSVAVDRELVAGVELDVVAGIAKLERFTVRDRHKGRPGGRVILSQANESEEEGGAPRLTGVFPGSERSPCSNRPA